jgi:tetratricopeptide (TPR) repeat protein/serine/threonine protein kinase
MSQESLNPESVFAQAIEIESPQDRAAFLEEACASAPELRREVEKLVVDYFRAGRFMEKPAARIITTADEPISECPGTVIGPYKLMEQIGEGGMGLVFVAEQQQPIRRKVALKVIKPGMDTRHVVARFEAERQALALMDHPNIARVLDGGETANGRPYFVMELVKGMPITEFCDQNQVPVRERLGLFLEVCHAVQHAHQKGIIHRDIKPSNVLVMSHDGTPRVKVIDFGVAKAIAQQLTDKTLYTQFTQLVGTPLYMSPEQAGQSGLDVDTRSDIYSLGVLLYELLTGTTPFDRDRLKEAGYDEIRRVIREEEPPRPSARITTMGQAATTVSTNRKSDPRQLSRLYRGDLDWIVMKALEKDRNRRYDTASTFAADVQRYLSDEPVQACPPSAAYRLQKFARRNKTRLATTGVIVFASLFAAGALGWSLWRGQEAARDQAMRDAALKLTVDSALDEAEAFARGAKIPEASAAVGRAEKLLKAAGRQEFPLRLVELQNDLGFAEHLEDINSNPKTEEFVWGHEPDAAYARAFANAGIDVTAMPVIEAAHRIRARSIGRELVRALEIWSLMRHRSETHGGGTKSGPDWKQLLGIAAAADVDSDSLRNQVRQALKRGDRNTLESLGRTADVGKLPVESLVLLANALYESGGKDQALALARRAVLVHPEDWWLNQYLGWWSFIAQPPQYHDAIRYCAVCQAIRPRNPYTLITIGRAQAWMKMHAEAVATFSRVLELKPDFGEVWRWRAAVYFNLGQWENALPDLSKAIEFNPKDAELWHNRGYTYNCLHQYDRAIPDLTKALELDPKYISAWTNRGRAHRDLHQYDKALADFSKAVALDPKDATPWTGRGRAYRDLHQYDKALADLNKALELDPKDAGAWNIRGQTYTELHQYDKALADFNKAIELNPKLTANWVNRGGAYLRMGQCEKALADLNKALELEPNNAVAWKNRSRAYRDLHQYDKALADLNKALELDPKDAVAWNNRGLAHRGLHQDAKAHADFSTALELDPKYIAAWTNRAGFYFELQHYDKAVADFSKTVELEPKNAMAWNRRGGAYLRLKQWDKALDDVSAALALQPDDPGIQTHLAWLLATHPEANKRDPRRAVELAQKAVNRVPRHASYWTALGVARYRTADEPGAVAALQEAVKRFQGLGGFQPGIARSCFFFLAMAQHKAGHAPEARQAYERAVAWLNANQQDLEKDPWAADEMRRFRAEAQEVLGMKHGN